jgi:RNA polymerase sigma factor (sigma-70 family)
MNSLALLSAEARAVPATAPHNATLRRIDSEDDEGRFSRVVLPHLADAYALARWLTGSVTDAQDVVQEASIRALRGIGKFANGNARAWVLTIVRNTAYDWLHKNRPTALVFVDRLEDVEGARPTDPDATTPETALIRIEDERRLETAISTLPAHFRETLLLRDVQGLTYRDIAERSGVSIGTVMSRLFRARRQLIGLMKQNGERNPCHAGTHPSRGISADHRQSPPMTVRDGDSGAEWSETLPLTA